jgi:hypothetical protein
MTVNTTFGIQKTKPIKPNFQKDQMTALEAGMTEHFLQNKANFQDVK